MSPISLEQLKRPLVALSLAATMWLGSNASALAQEQAAGTTMVELATQEVGSPTNATECPPIPHTSYKTTPDGGCIYYADNAPDGGAVENPRATTTIPLRTTTTTTALKPTTTTIQLEIIDGQVSAGVETDSADDDSTTEKSNAKNWILFALEALALTGMASSAAIRYRRRAS